MARRTVFWLALLLLCGANAQIVVPTFGARGEVPQAAVGRFMRVFRQQLGLRTGLTVLSGTTAAQTLIGRLQPDVAAAIATLGGGRYSVAGEITALDTGLTTSYTVNLLVTDARTRRSSDLFSQPLEFADLPTTVAALTRAVGAFINPAAALARGSASLFITSTPEGASIYLNGTLVGTTAQPRELPLAPGRYAVELRKEGYVPEGDMVTLEAQDTQFLALSLTEIRGGSILVGSVPSAEVFLDGRRVGRTPLTVEAAPGVRTLRLVRPGFRSQTQSVTVRNFFVSRISPVRLEPTFESLVFWTPPTGFTVSVDGIARPRNFAPSLQPGTHRAVLSRRGVDIPFTFTLPRRGVFELDVQTHEVRALE